MFFLASSTAHHSTRQKYQKQPNRSNAAPSSTSRKQKKTSTHTQLVFPQKSLPDPTLPSGNTSSSAVSFATSGTVTTRAGTVTIIRDIPRIQPVYDDLFERFPGDTIRLNQEELQTLSAICSHLPDSHLQSLFDFIQIAAPDKARDLFTERMEAIEQNRIERLKEASKDSTKVSSKDDSPSSSVPTQSTVDEDFPLYDIDPFSTVVFEVTDFAPIVQRNLYNYAVTLLSTLCQTLSIQMPVSIPTPPPGVIPPSIPQATTRIPAFLTSSSPSRSILPPPFLPPIHSQRQTDSIAAEQNTPG